MSVIDKYLIKYNQETNEMYVDIPKNAKPFSMRLEDRDKAYIYCIIDKNEHETIEKEILWIGTGWDINEEIEDKIKYYTFLGTYKYNDLVWHFWMEPMWEEWEVYDFETGKPTTFSTNPFKQSKEE